MANDDSKEDSAGRPNDPVSRARRRGARVALVIFIAFAVAFVAISTAEIVADGFGLTVVPIAQSGVLPGEGCAEGLRALAGALDRAGARTFLANDEAEAVARFQEALAPEWDGRPGIEARCAAAPHGSDAFAALLRQRAVAEGLVRRAAAEMGPVRRDVASYLPH